MSGHPQVKVGVIGTGWVATDRHIPAFKRDKRATLTAVFDRDLGKAQSTAKRFRVPSFTDNLDSFLNEPLDVVSICTPPHAHAEFIEASIRSGKHVLVEKPITLTSEVGRSLEVLAQEAGVILCPAHSHLFSRSALKAKSLWEKGNVGEVQWAMGIQLTSWQRRLPTWYDELPGGLFFDESPHLLYLMRHFLGDVHVEQAWSTDASSNSPATMDRTEVRLKGKRGTGYLTMCFGSPFSEWLFILFCSQGVLVLDLFRDILIHLPPEKAHKARDVLKTSARGTFEFWRGIGASGIQAARRQYSFGHDELVKRFLDSVIDGKELPVSARDGWKTVALIEDILHRTSPTA
ncbi:MAG: Gfo/Idh/MocA family oxidoreductase [Chloroflexi bacterium]|nr:Gfo/Idh/MocA family oxidoreductase [Chloroflexota bacterium]